MRLVGSQYINDPEDDADMRRVRATGCRVVDGICHGIDWPECCGASVKNAEIKVDAVKSVATFKGITT